MKPVQARDSAPPGFDEAQIEAMRARLRATEQVNFVVASRLRAARARAVEAAEAPAYLRWLRRGHWLGPVSALTAALTIALWMPEQAGVPGALPPVSDVARNENLEVLLDDNEPEFYEDLELYRWLEQDSADKV